MASGIDPSTYESRQDRLVSGLDVDAVVVVSRASDIRWLTGFSGSNAFVVLRRSERLLLTDGRYEQQAADEATVGAVRIVQGDLIGGLPGALPTSSFAGMVLFQADDLTVDRATRLRRALEKAQVEPLGDRLSALRVSKDLAEIGLVRDALALSEEIMAKIPDVLRPGVTEREVAAEIDYRHRLAGADGSAFETIVAFGPRAALPHARPGDVSLEPGDCILLDFGCVANGYRSDITRMMVLGTPPDGFHTAYRAVEQALHAAEDAVEADMDGRALDGVARGSLRREGLDEYFSHGLGHGVGLDIHEGPRVSSVTSSRIPEGAIITIEPGVYLPGRFGIRIENMILVDSSGGRVLNSLDTSLITL